MSRGHLKSQEPVPYRSVETFFRPLQSISLLKFKRNLPTMNNNQDIASRSRVPPSMLSSLLGTWTLQTHASSSFGLYKASAFLVMHVMQDPLQSYSCSLIDCEERQNKFCQRDLDQCADIENTISQWSDVSIFFQFGFDIEEGTYPWRTRIAQNTSDWIGPYNVILPQKNYQLTARYVTTVATDYLLPPPNQTLTPPSLFDPYAGATAVHNTILQQAQLRPTEDPYERQLEACNYGDIHPILPRFTLSQHKNFAMDFLLLSLPSTKESLYKVWPGVQKHLPEFPVVGPYCFQGDPTRAYAVNISFDTTRSENNTWKFTPGCIPDLPCWPSHPGPKPHGGGNDGPNSSSSIFWNALATYGIYFLLFGFVISWTVNCQLSYQLQRLREESGNMTDRRRISPTTTNGEMETPLLDSTIEEMNASLLNEAMPQEIEKTPHDTSRLSVAEECD